MGSKIISGITSDKSVRIYVVDSTEMVEQARMIHKATPLSTAALGRVISATSIMGRMLKSEKESLTIQVKGNGEIRSIIGVGNAEGNVKVYISNPDVVRPANAQGKIDVGGAIGEGHLIVIKDLGMKEPFIGRSELVSGEIAEDLAAYYMQSEQQPSVVSLGVLMDQEIGGVVAAGGIIIQPLPFADDDVIDKIERSIMGLPAISTLISEGNSVEDIARIALKEFEVEIISEKPVALYCDCSRERVEKALISLGKNELTDMLETDGHAELSCHFCNKKYQFDTENLKNLISSLDEK
ncbi:MAG: Hsp33 family molecular chaperone HslO [Clostridia bacterium]|nr:Hsp33 family molecular chaperone HslO [Clostridia bacterium]